MRAKILARGGELKAADDLVRGAIRLAESSDGLNRQAKAQGDRAEILLLAGRSDEAASAFDRALELYERKGNIAGVVRTRAQSRKLALV